jgi:hypothetical protein
VPVGILSGLCVAMFVFIWWWFPRTWKKGVKQDMDRIDEELRQRQEHQARQDLEAGNAAHGTAEELPAGQDGMPAAPPPTKLPSTFTYRPPAYTSY